jgi:hypothetical protein
MLNFKRFSALDLKAIDYSKYLIVIKQHKILLLTSVCDSLREVFNQLLLRILTINLRFIMKIPQTLPRRNFPLNFHSIFPAKKPSNYVKNWFSNFSIHFHPANNENNGIRQSENFSN